MVWERIDFLRKTSLIGALLLYFLMYCLFIIWYKLVLFNAYKTIMGTHSKKLKTEKKE